MSPRMMFDKQRIFLSSLDKAGCLASLFIEFGNYRSSETSLKGERIAEFPDPIIAPQDVFPAESYDITRRESSWLAEISGTS